MFARCGGFAAGQWKALATKSATYLPGKSMFMRASIRHRLLGRVYGETVFPGPGILQPMIVDMNLRRLMAGGLEIAGIKIGHAKQAVIARLHLHGIGSLAQIRLAIQRPQKTGIIGIEYQNAHGICL